MDDIRMNVTESQLDKLAGRVAELERMLDCLVKTLEAPAIAGRIGLTGAHVQRIRNTFLTVSHAEMRHYNERAKAVADAEKDRIFNRLRSEPGLAYPEERRRLVQIEASAAAIGKGAAAVRRTRVLTQKPATTSPKRRTR
jgi:hypothetical protein